MKNVSPLDLKLAKIQMVFDTKKIVNLPTSITYTQEYYKQNKLWYSLFHTFSNRIYMGISRTGKYENDDLLEAARFVKKYIKLLNASRVLELATGRGATSSYLAPQHKKVTFDGIDISDAQLSFARKRAKMLTNYHPIQGDYHDLSMYKDKTFDIVFEIEAVCYSQDKEKVLKEVHRVLKKGGVFILFDGYLKKDRNTLSKDELMAEILTEKAMAVPEFENYEDFIKKAKKQDFSIDYEEDVSAFIMPTLRKFEKLAKFFFAAPPLAKAIHKSFSKEFTYNAVAGYLMPYIISEGICSYYITVLKK